MLAVWIAAFGAVASVAAEAKPPEGEAAAEEVRTRAVQAAREVIDVKDAAMKQADQSPLLKFLLKNSGALPSVPTASSEAKSYRDMFVSREADVFGKLNDEERTRKAAQAAAKAFPGLGGAHQKIRHEAMLNNREEVNRLLADLVSKSTLEARPGIVLDAIFGYAVHPQGHDEAERLLVVWEAAVKEVEEEGIRSGYSRRPESMNRRIKDLRLILPYLHQWELLAREYQTSDRPLSAEHYAETTWLASRIRPDLARGMIRTALGVMPAFKPNPHHGGKMIGHDEVSRHLTGWYIAASMAAVGDARLRQAVQGMERMERTNQYTPSPIAGRALVLLGESVAGLEEAVVAERLEALRAEAKAEVELAATGAAKDGEVPNVFAMRRLGGMYRTLGWVAAMLGDDAATLEWVKGVEDPFLRGYAAMGAAEGVADRYREFLMRQANGRRAR